MRPSLTRLVLAGTAAALVAAAPAQATPKSFYFSCGTAANSRITNGAGSSGSWTATKPATAFQSGGGCLTVDPWVAGASPGNTVYDTVFTGTYSGEVKQLDLTLYGFSNPAYRQLLPLSIDVTIQVDGGDVVTLTDLETTSEPQTNNSHKGTWTISDLDIPASATAKSYVITVNSHFTDDPNIWGRGASDLASGVTFYSHEDLPDPEEY